MLTVLIVGFVVFALVVVVVAVDVVATVVAGFC